MITWRKAESWLWVQDINVQKNQQMLSSFFFSVCEVLKAGSSGKLILPHANCWFIMLVHAESHFASLKAPLIRLHDHIEHVFAAQSCALQFCLSKHPLQHDYIQMRSCHAVIDMQQRSHSGNVQMVKSMWPSKMANLTPYGTSSAWLIMQLRVSWFSRRLVLSMQTNTQVRSLHSMIANMEL